MKTKLLILLLAILLTSCVPLKAPYPRIGMTIQEFEKQAKYEELINIEGDYAVYRVVYGYHADNYMFYYFKNGKLVKANRGQRDVDWRVRLN